jgi:NAD(P)H dehydrogenase (quinone)
MANDRRSSTLSKILVLYYSTSGHVATMAQAVAEGARSVAGAEVSIKRVPESMPPEVAATAGAKPDPSIPLAVPEELEQYDAIIFGTPTRFGNMAAQMKNFVDRTGALWFGDKLVGKVGSVFTSTGSQHGGQESTLLTFHPVLMHLGMVVVGLPYTFKGQMGMDEITGGTPYGATTIVGHGERQPSANELDGARFQGHYVTELATALERGRQALAA